MKAPKEFLRVDLDWSSTGIWILEEPLQKTAGENAAYENLNLPPWLIERFHVWTKWYNACEPWNGNKNQLDDDMFEAYGLSPAIDLKRFLGTNYYVEFRKMEIVNLDRPMSREFARKHYVPIEE